MGIPKKQKNPKRNRQVVTIDRAGRLIIPRRLRERFGFKLRSEIKIEETAQGILLEPIKTSSALEMEEGVLVHTGVPLEPIEDWVQTHREERISQLVWKAAEPKRRKR
jgi:AbrB family looped-hinge helix DNA binding protein